MAENRLLITIVIMMILLLIGAIMVVLMVAYNSRKPEVQRKWTDPSFRERIPGDEKK